MREWTQREWVSAYIGIGANLGDPVAAVQAALHALAQLDGVRAPRRSGLYRSAPLDSSGPDYVNAVLALQTQHTAPHLLAQLQHIEAQAGRERPYRNAPRTLDLDLLLYGQGQIQSATLTLPHPRMWERAFVLLPLAELAPGLVSADALQRVQGQALNRVTHY